jgi:outer membrane protein assembly factor BamB
MSAPGKQNWSRRTFLFRTAAIAAGLTEFKSRSDAAQEDKAPSPSGLQIPANCWPWWRGPNYDNVVPSATPPLAWNSTQNVLWKTELPGRGHASPIVWAGKIFFPAADEDQQLLWMLAFDFSSGKQLWSTDLHKGGFMKKHDKNSHASATPACDGERIFFPALYDGALWVHALDLNGTLLWKERVGGFVPSNGYGSSPVIYKQLVIVSSDNTGEPCLVGLERKTGHTIWRAERPKADNFSTPTLAILSGRPQVLMCGARLMAGYDPEDGKQLWFANTPTEVTACTPAFGEDLVFGGGNVPVRQSVCVRTDGHGDVTDTRVLWRSSKNVTYVPSPIIRDGLLYIVDDGGFAHCIDAKTGEDIYKERIGGDFSSSPVLVGDRIYATNERGETVVLRAGRKFEILARNSLDEPVLATPVFIGSSIIMRTAKNLFRINGS